jgi:signal transduction histidine kinase
LNLENKNKQKLILIILTLSVFSVFILLIVRKYVQSKREQKLQENFSQRLLNVQEEERLKISRDLHDSVGQSLSLVKREVQKREIAEIDHLLGTTIQDLREVSQSIYPYNLKKFGLSYAVQQLSNNIESTSELKVKLKIQDIDKEAGEELILNIYRLIQEALNNVVKHAHAKHIEVVVMKKPSEVVVKIKDDGEGFDVKYKMKTSKSFGLQTMQQRINIIKGKFSIESNLEGTKLEAYIPLV